MSTMSGPNQLEDLSPDQRRALLQNLLKQKSDAGKRFPMSEGQQGLWYAFRRDPQQTAFNVFLPSRVRSPLNLPSLRAAVEFLVDRHASLRTTFSDSGAELSQRVHDVLTPEFNVVDASEFSEPELLQAVSQESQRPFDLENGPMLRMSVWKKHSDDFVVLASTHHIVVDFWSLVLLLEELRHVYPAFEDDRQPQLPPITGQYRSFVSRQQALMVGEGGKRQQAYWRQQLRGVPTVLEWVTDFERPPQFTGRADVQSLEIPKRVLPKLIDVAQQARVTTSAVVLAAVEAFIARCARQKSFMIGTPFSGRGSRQFERTVGFFVNMLPMKADLTDDPSFLDFVRRVGHGLVAGLEHQDYPLAQIVRDVQPVRDPSRTPLFQVSCTFEKAQIREEAGRAGFLLPTEQSFDFGGLQQESYYVPHATCHYDVEFIFEQTEAELRGMICYCSDLFAKDTMERIARNFAAFLEALLDSPRQQVDRVCWESTLVGKVASQSHPTDPRTLVDLLDGIPGDTPNALATRIHGRIHTHGQLRELTQRIARQLVRRGVRRGDLIPVIARKGPLALAGILGVIRSGAAVIPIDADQPAISAEDLFADANPKFAVADTRSVVLNGKPDPRIVTLDELSESVDGPELPRPAADDLAYVIYTSGSSGKPKGVMIRHAAIVNTLLWRMKHVGLSVDDRMLMLLSHQFDAGFGLMLGCVVQGAALIWGDEDAGRDVNRLVEQLRRDHISVLGSVPSWYRLLARHPKFGECRELTQVWMGGEAMPADLPGLIRASSSARIWNFYGPTETAVEAAAWEVTDHDTRRRVPIGHAISNTELLILDEHLQPVPDTIPGQLAICGHGLADGYFNEPVLTAQKFVPAAGHDASTAQREPSRPVAGQRMYLTGDLCRRRADGAVEFLGRMDDQVKLHGHRIELEEIDSVLQSHPLVKQSAVKLINADTTAAAIAAYVTCSDRQQTKPSELVDVLHQHVTKRLPQFKRPASITVLDRLPVGSSGKVLRHQLPDPAEQTSTVSVPPSTPLEQYLADGWCDTLEVEQVGVNQDFFQLGGTSLQAAMLTAKLSEDLGVHVPTSLLFDLADIRQLSQRLVQLHEVEMTARFGLESVTAYAQDAIANSPVAEVSAVSASNQPDHPLLAKLKPEGTLDPVFMVHPPGGIVVCYRELAEQLSPEQPLIAIRSRGLHGRETLPSTMEEMASDYVEAIRSVQPKGPYLIGGWSLGGIVGYEIARQLKLAGQPVKRLILLDTSIPEGSSQSAEIDEGRNVGREYGIDLSLQELNELPAEEQLPFLWQHAVNLGVIDDDAPAEVVTRVLEDLQSLFQHHVRLASAYRLTPMDLSVLLLRPMDVPFEVKSSRDRGWANLVSDVQVRDVTGHHHSMVQMPHVEGLAAVIEHNLADRVSHPE